MGKWEVRGMEAEFRKELHPVLETLGLILVMKNFNSIKSDLLRSLNEMEIDGEMFYERNLSFLENYVGEFEKKYIADPKEDFFFGKCFEFFQMVSALVIEYPELEAEIDALTDEAVLRKVELFLEDVKGKAPGTGTMEERFAAIQSIDCAEDTKWKLFMLLNHPLDQFRALARIYRKNRPAFDYTVEKNRECLDALLLAAPAEASAAMGNLIAGVAEGPVAVYWTAVFPVMEWLLSHTAFQGILADKLDLHKKGISDAREILPGMLKVLGDKSKFEILCSVKERGKYNLEIAKELGITPATASHHMGILLSSHFVEVEKREGRVYYHLNQDTVREMIGFLEGIFLHS